MLENLNHFTYESLWDIPTRTSFKRRKFRLLLKEMPRESQWLCREIKAHFPVRAVLCGCV